MGILNLLKLRDVASEEYVSWSSPTHCDVTRHFQKPAWVIQTWKMTVERINVWLQQKQSLESSSTLKMSHLNGAQNFVWVDNNGCTVDFSVYTGKYHTAWFDAVRSLVNKDCLGPGYHICCHSYYSSRALFRHLRDFGFGACGTYHDGHRQQKKIIPPGGSWESLYIGSDTASFFLWNELIRGRSLFVPPFIPHALGKLLRGRKTSDGGYERISIPRQLAAIRGYNGYYT